MRKIRIYSLLLILFQVLVFFSCARETDRELILEMMEDIAKLIEAKDTARVMEKLSEDYADFEARGKRETEEMVKDYFQNYRGIVIHILSTRFDDLSVAGASIETDVVLSSGGAVAFRKAVPFTGDFYRFKMKLRKGGDAWRIQYAEWAGISLEDLFPESLSILKKIFPGI